MMKRKCCKTVVWKGTHRCGIQSLFAVFSLLITCPAVSAQEATSEPSNQSLDLSHFFDDDYEPIPETERPTQFTPTLPETLDEVSRPANASEREELASWVRWLVLLNLPPSYEDNRKWNRTKEVFDGIQFRREGWKLETKRKRKTAKHGTWSRYYLEFIEPEERLAIEISKIDFPSGAPIRIETKVIAPLKCFGRVSEWIRDVQLYSISTNATATIELNVVCDVQVRINPLKVPPDVEFLPVVLDASVVLQNLDVERISQIHGPVADMLGKGIREVLDARLEDYREKLVQKMNTEIVKQKGKLKISIQEWLETSVSKKSTGSTGQAVRD